MSFLLALLLSPTASAVPTELSHSGRLLDNAGMPLSGQYTLNVTLYSDTTGTVVWSDDLLTDFDNGYFAITLGSTTPLDDSVFTGANRWIGLAVDSGPELGLQPVQSVPYAIRASTATNVSGGRVEASELVVGGNTIVDSSGQMVSGGTLGSLSCSSSGQVASYDGSAWGCANPSWANLDQVPAGFADGADDDTLVGLSCVNGQVAAWDAVGAGWACAANTDTTYTAGNGLLLSGADFSVDDAVVFTEAEASVHASDPAAHHVRYTDADAVTALVGHTSDPAAHHLRYTDSDAVTALQGHTDDPAAHHTRYADVDAISAIENAASIGLVGDLTTAGIITADALNAPDSYGPYGTGTFTTDLTTNNPNDAPDTHLLTNIRCSGHWGSYAVEIELITRYYRPAVRRFTYYCGNGNHTLGGTLTEVGPNGGFDGGGLASLRLVNLGATGLFHSGIEMYDAQIWVDQPAYVKTYLRVHTYGYWPSYKAGTAFSDTTPSIVWETWN